MHWPSASVETVHPSRFMPPFCPWPDCLAHKSPGRGFQRNGWYRKPSSIRTIPRYRCRECRRTCSRATFSTTYYLKRPALLTAVASGLAACSAHRQIARSNHCAKTTVTRMAERLSRHAILFHARCLGELGTTDEPLVHDHFETFIARQDKALGIGTAVGSTSWFVYDVDPAPHDGSGRRPDRKPVPVMPTAANRSYIKSIRRTFAALIEHTSDGERLTFCVDGRADYRFALRLPELRSRITLRIYPNPKRGPKGSPRAPEARARDEAMFPVDQFHQLLRHTCSDHKRETISFGRRLESIVGRAHLIAVWKNFIKRRTERRPCWTTPAMVVGLAEHPWRWERILSRRLFPGREPVTEVGRSIYQKRWTTTLPALSRRHAA